MIVVLSSGCAAVGIDYVSPEADVPNAWQYNLQNPAVKEAADPELLKQWWKSFNDDTLNTLIAKTEENNKTLKSARFALSAARAKLRATDAGHMPSLDASGSAKGIHYGDSRLPDQNIDSYSAGLDASWEIDVFGGLKRETEAVTADMQATAESLRDTLVSLLAETATNYINLRTYQQSLATADEDIRLNTELYELTENRYKAGLVDEAELKKALYQLEYSRTKPDDLKAKIDAAMNRLSVLTGEKPGAVNELLVKGGMPRIPVEAAVGIPADAIRRRPDVRMSERQLAAQTARIGAAKSDLYPKFTLAGSLGYQSGNTGSLFDNKNMTLSAGPSFRWALFDFGAIRQNINVQTETQKKYLADYESSVLSALEDVENAMSAFDREKSKSVQLEKALNAAKEAYDLEYKKYTAGLADYTDVINTESAYISYKDSLTQSRAGTGIYLISLYKALGGGWQSYEVKDEKQN